MLTAIRDNDGTKVVGDLIEKDADAKYHCDFCRNSVIHHKSESRIKIGHFKHKTGDSHCPNAPESIEHLESKLQIYTLIKNHFGDKLPILELEKWICSNSIRPDIYVETRRGTKIAIEVQASALGVTEIKRRTEKYFSQGIYVMWVILFDYERFYEYKTVYGWNEDNKWEALDTDWYLRDRVRLKEFEIFLYWAYYKKIIFWDYKQKFSKGFIVAELTEHRTDIVEFRKDKEDQVGGGRVTKVMKVPKEIIRYVPFDVFRPQHAREFKSHLREYTIPERLIFTLDDREKMRKLKAKQRSQV